MMSPSDGSRRSESRALGSLAVLALIAGGCFKNTIPPNLTCDPEVQDCPGSLSCSAQGVCVEYSIACPTDGTRVLLDTFDGYDTGTWDPIPPWHRVFQPEPDQITIEIASDHRLTLEGTTSTAVDTVEDFSNFEMTLRVQVRRYSGVVALDFNHQVPESPVQTNRIVIENDGWKFQRHVSGQADVDLALSTGSTGPGFALGTWYTVRVTQTVPSFTFERCDEASGNWQLLGTSSDTTFTTGKLGFSVFDSDVDFDDVAVYNPD